MTCENAVGDIFLNNQSLLVVQCGGRDTTAFIGMDRLVALMQDPLRRM